MVTIVTTFPSVADLRSVIAHGASESVALVDGKATVRSLAETLTALANGKGGLMVVNAGRDGHRSGADGLEQVRERVAAALLLPHPPLVVPMSEFVELDGAALYVVEVPAGLPHVYSLKGQYLVRSGRQNRPLLPEELRRLLVNRSEVSFESQTPADASIADLDAERVSAYVDRLGRTSSSTPIDHLVSRGCLTIAAADSRPTLAGLVLFGRDPQRWLRGATVTCVRYPGEQMSDDFVREDIGGVLSDQIRRAEAFVVANMRRGMRIRGLTREELDEYPLSVVREAIVNAVAHRDYSIRGDGIRVLMFSSRLEVYSPGRLPGHVTLANLVDERFSRNEAIVQVLSEMGFIERLGYGIDRMISVCESEGLAPPQFAELSGGFKVTIFGRGPELVGALPPPGLWAHLHLNPRQEQALAFLQQHRRITNSDFQTLCPEASSETLRRDFADLVDRSILLKIGEKRATYYVLK